MLIFLDALMLPFLYFFIIFAEALILTFGWIKVFRNQNLKPHRKAFWIFILLTSSFIGLMAYLNTDGKLKDKKPVK